MTMFEDELQDIIEGALFDLLAYMTCQEGEITLGASLNSARAVEVFDAWKGARGLTRPEGNPHVADWMERGEGLKAMAAGPLTTPQGEATEALVECRDCGLVHDVGERLTMSVCPDEGCARGLQTSSPVRGGKQKGDRVFPLNG